MLQGGGALGAYQVGVYQAMHEAGIEPDWVIGTSIGAINASLIAGNAPADRLERLDAFWDQMQAHAPSAPALDWLGLGNLAANLATVMRGIPDFFTPNLHALARPERRAGRRGRRVLQHRAAARDADRRWSTSTTCASAARA